MGSMYAALTRQSTVGSSNTTRLCDFDETDPYYFVVREGDKILAEGELMKVKLKLDDSYLYKKIKRFERDKITMIASVVF